MTVKGKENNTNNEQEGGEAFSPAQTEALNAMMNRVMTGRLARDKQSDAKAISEAMAEQFAKMKEELKGEILGPEPKEIETTGGKKKVDSEIAAQLEALKKQNDRIQKQLEEAQAEKARVEQANWEAGARGALNAALRKAGVNNDDLLAGAAELLYKRIGKGEGGKPTVKVQREGYEEDLEIEKFVTGEWAKGQGKAFLPAKPAAGSGGHRVANSNPGRASSTDGELLSQMRNRALGAMENLAFGPTGDDD